MTKKVLEMYLLKICETMPPSDSQGRHMDK